MAANFPPNQWGITAPQFRHPSTPRSTLTINSKEDDKTVTINSRDYAKSSNSAVGFQCKPNQAEGTGSSVKGCDIQPRFASGVGGVNLIGANISGILKGATGDLSGEVHVLELETDFDQNQTPTRTITGDVTLLRFSGGFPNSMTFSGKKTCMQVAPAQSGPYDAFIKFDTTNTDLFKAKSAAAVTHVIPVLLGNTTYYIMVSNQL